MSQAAIWVHQNYEGALLGDFMRAAGREAGDAGDGSLWVVDAGTERDVFTIRRKIWSSNSISTNKEMRAFVFVFGFIASCFGVLQE